METKECSNCKYCSCKRDPASWAKHLTCHRYPPQAIKYVLDSGHVFPTVKPDDWCGEWDKDR